MLNIVDELLERSNESDIACRAKIVHVYYAYLHKVQHESPNYAIFFLLLYCILIVLSNYDY